LIGRSIRASSTFSHTDLSSSFAISEKEKVAYLRGRDSRNIRSKAIGSSRHRFPALNQEGRIRVAVPVSARQQLHRKPVKRKLAGHEKSAKHRKVEELIATCASRFRLTYIPIQHKLIKLQYDARGEILRPFGLLFSR
jgi:hypothetical protein